jgi:hypothetical protein
MTVNLLKRQGNDMTFFHLLNYSIPIIFMVFLGFMIDKMCKPIKEKE